MSEPCDFEAMSALAEEHKRLAPFVGTFRAEVKIWMGPGEPSISTGTMINTFELGGRFLQQVYKRDSGGGPFANFEGRGYWGFNKATKKYEGFWIDTASTIMQMETGQVDKSGKVWTMAGSFTDPGSGRPMTKRSVITLQDKDHHSLEMFFPGPDGKDAKGMEIRYTRSK